MTEIIRLSAKTALADSTLNLIAVSPDDPLDLHTAPTKLTAAFCQIEGVLVKSERLICDECLTNQSRPCGNPLWAGSDSIYAL
jgi:hypothetical protein